MAGIGALIKLIKGVGTASSTAAKTTAKAGVSTAKAGKQTAKAGAGTAKAGANTAKAGAKAGANTAKAAGRKGLIKKALMGAGGLGAVGAGLGSLFGGGDSEEQQSEGSASAGTGLETAQPQSGASQQTGLMLFDFAALLDSRMLPVNSLVELDIDLADYNKVETIIEKPISVPYDIEEMFDKERGELVIPQNTALEFSSDKISDLARAVVTLQENLKSVNGQINTLNSRTASLEEAVKEAQDLNRRAVLDYERQKDEEALEEGKPGTGGGEQGFIGRRLEDAKTAAKGGLIAMATGVVAAGLAVAGNELSNWFNAASETAEQARQDALAAGASEEEAERIYQETLEQAEGETLADEAAIATGVGVAAGVGYKATGAVMNQADRLARSSVGQKMGMKTAAEKAGERAAKQAAKAGATEATQAAARTAGREAAEAVAADGGSVRAQRKAANKAAKAVTRGAAGEVAEAGARLMAVGGERLAGMADNAAPRIAGAIGKIAPTKMAKLTGMAVPGVSWLVGGAIALYQVAQGDYAGAAVTAVGSVGGAATAIPALVYEIGREVYNAVYGDPESEEESERFPFEYDAVSDPGLFAERNTEIKDAVSEWVADWWADNEEYPEDEESLNSAIEKGIYDHDLMGDSEVDLSRISELTVNEMKAIIADDDIDDETAEALRNAIAGKEEEESAQGATESYSGTISGATPEQAAAFAAAGVGPVGTPTPTGATSTTGTTPDGSLRTGNVERPTALRGGEIPAATGTPTPQDGVFATKDQAREYANAEGMQSYKFETVYNDSGDPIGYKVIPTRSKVYYNGTLMPMEEIESLAQQMHGVGADFMVAAKTDKQKEVKDAVTSRIYDLGRELSKGDVGREGEIRDGIEMYVKEHMQKLEQSSLGREVETAEQAMLEDAQLVPPQEYDYEPYTPGVTDGVTETPVASTAPVSDMPAIASATGVPPAAKPQGMDIDVTEIVGRVGTERYITLRKALTEELGMPKDMAGIAASMLRDGASPKVVNAWARTGVKLESGIGTPELEEMVSLLEAGMDEQILYRWLDDIGESNPNGWVSMARNQLWAKQNNQQTETAENAAPNIVSTNTSSSADAMLATPQSQESSPVVVPIISKGGQQAPQQRYPTPLGMGSKSQSEPAFPTVSTKDSFLAGSMDPRS